MKMYVDFYNKEYDKLWVYNNLANAFLVCEIIKKTKSQTIVKILAAFDNEMEQSNYVTLGVQEKYGDVLDIFWSIPVDYDRTLFDRNWFLG